MNRSGIMTENIKEETKKHYYERINKVVDYINNHLDENLDLNNLAVKGCYSTFHFQRIMRAYLGESPGAYIVRLRLETSAHLLRASDKPVNEIASSVGYENPSSYNKAFKKRFDISPLEYRENKTMQIKITANNLKTDIMENLDLKPKIKELKEKKVIYAQALGPYSESAKKTWDAVCLFAKKNRLFGFKTEFIGISHDDPDVTEQEKLRYDACLTISREVKTEGEIGVKNISGGKYAIFTHKGPYEKFSDSYRYIYGKWIPENNIGLREAPCYEKYLNSPDKVKPEKLLTKIFIPIK